MLTIKSLELKSPTKQKKNRISYAAVVGRGRKKQHAASNHWAYKAWEERKATGSKIFAPDKAPAKVPKLNLPEKKMGCFKTRGERRKL